MQFELVEFRSPGAVLPSWTSRLMVSVIVILGAISSSQVACARISRFESGASEQQGQTCSKACGDVPVPYPFGTDEGCGLPQFRLHCQQRETGAYSLLLSTGSGDEASGLEVLDILSDSLIVNATNLRASCCNCTSTRTLQLDDSLPYAVSGDNLFFVNGCNSHGSFTSDKSVGYLMKCETGCDNPDRISENYCNSFGCCSSPVPSGSRTLTFSGGGPAQLSDSGSDSGSCGYSSIIYPESYTTPDAEVLGNGRYGLKLSWALQGPSPSSSSSSSSCEEALLQSTDYACSPEATCNFVQSVSGYTCSCNKKGYHGDGYKRGTGCAGETDTNECEDPQLKNCHPDATCTNYDGGHKCTCKALFVGDGLINGTGCELSARNFSSLTFAAHSSAADIEDDGACGEDGSECGRGNGKRRQSDLATLLAGIISTSVLLLVLCVIGAYWGFKLRSRHQPKDFYTRNLSKLTSISERFSFTYGKETAKMFTYKELSKSANGFSSDLEIGTGGYGTVFKGTLPNGTLVAIKKTNHVNDAGSEQFLNEVSILSQVNHRNLVKLLGCCLETEVPMLVYEYIPNGTLYEHLQKLLGESIVEPLGWSQRLQIAIETAEALTYLHSHAFPPIYHRDVKSTNILLGTNLTVKVTDFGLSRVVPDAATHVSTVVMGTPGYMDPEYYHNYQLTDKSDVYSFGVVLLELITSMKPVDFERKCSQINLAILSIPAIKGGNLAEIVDPFLLTLSDHEPKVMESIEAVALLALDCLAPQRDYRPTMKEVVEHLYKIKDTLNPDTSDRSPMNSDRICVKFHLDDETFLQENLLSGTASECSLVLTNLDPEAR